MVSLTPDPLLFLHHFLGLYCGLTSLRYHDQSTDDALELFRWLRRKSYLLIKSLPESVWSNNAHHPESGNITLDDWLDTYERHIPEHVQYMKENYETWIKGG